MLLNLRKKIITWLRDTDDYEYNERGELIRTDNDNDGGESPPDQAAVSARRRPSLSKRNTVGGSTVESNSNIDSPRIRFNVYRAQGGIVIETSQYDTKIHETVNSLFVLNEDSDLGEELSKIIILQSLRG